jgi:hypothetical protein
MCTTTTLVFKDCTDAPADWRGNHGERSVNSPDTTHRQRQRSVDGIALDRRQGRQIRDSAQMLDHLVRKTGGEPLEIHVSEIPTEPLLQHDLAQDQANG